MKNRDIFAHNLSDIGKSEVPVNVKSMASGGQTSALLAPNGKPSNLTPEQYRLVRTPEFKKWFGDWENPVRYTGYFVIDPEALQQKYPSSLPNKFYHHSTVKYGYQPFDTQDGNVKTLKITGRLTTDKVDVLLVDNPESANGYPHITLATANGIAAAESNQELVEHADQIEKLFDEVDTIFGNSFRHDVSKVVDENGEPLVVYRGMPSNRKVGNVFRYNVNLFGTKGNAGRRTNKFGFYFADIEGVANDYAENFVADDVKPVVKQYFLKIDNLFTAFSRPNQIKLAFNELFDLAAQNNPTVAKEFLQDNYHENAHYNFLTQAKATWNEDHVFRFFVDWDKYDNNQAFWKTLLKDKLGYDGLVFYEKTHGVSDWKKDEPIWKYGRAPKTYAVWDSNQIKLADGTNTTFDGDNPDIRFEQGGQTFAEGVVELKMYGTTPQHAKEYGLESKNPLYVQTIIVADTKRLQGIGKKVLEYIDDFAIKNGHDVIFGHIGLTAKFTKDDRPTNLSDADMIKNWLAKNGYTINDANHDFHKVVKRFARGGRVGSEGFMDWFVGWYKGLADKMNIAITLPNVLMPFKEANVAVIDVFEKINQDVDAKEYLKAIVKKADEHGVTLYLEPVPRHTRLLDNAEKRAKITTSYLSRYYEQFGFVPTSNGNLMKREPVSNFVDCDNPDIMFGRGGKVIADKRALDKYQRVGITDKYDIEALNEISIPPSTAFERQSLIGAIKAAYESLADSHSDYLISEDSQAITKTILNEVNARYIDGDTDENIRMLQNQAEDQSKRREYIDKFRKTQSDTIGEWVNYLNSSKYPYSFRFLILKAVLNFNYDFKTNGLVKRTNKTTRNFTPFDAGTLAQVYDSQSDYLLKDYTLAQMDNAESIAKSKEFVKTSDGGRWLRFKGGDGATAVEIDENSKQLAQLVQDTYWCTKTAAKSQLKGGDFYVYVTESGGKQFPRIAVRMEGDEVGEVRGNQSSAQDIEPEMLPLAEEFLVNSLPDDSGRKWLESIRYNERALKVYEMLKQGGLYNGCVEEYVLLKKDEKRHLVDYANENGHIRRISDLLLDLLGKPNKIYQPQEVVFASRFFNPEKTRIILGDADFAPLKITSLGQLQFIMGNAYFGFDEIKSLGNLHVIGGKADFRFSELKSLGKLQSIGGEADFRDSEIISLGNLQSIGGGADFKDSKIKSLGKLQSIGGGADFIDSKITSFGNLQSIGQDVYINSPIKSIFEAEFEEEGDGYRRILKKNIDRFEQGGTIAIAEGNQSSRRRVEGKVKYVGSRKYIIMHSYPRPQIKKHWLEMEQVLKTLGFTAEMSPAQTTKSKYVRFDSDLHYGEVRFSDHSEAMDRHHYINSTEIDIYDVVTVDRPNSNGGQNIEIDIRSNEDFEFAKEWLQMTFGAAKMSNGGGVENQSIKSYLQSEGFEILKDGIVKYNDVEVALWMQRKYTIKRGQKYMVEVGSPFEPNDSDDYGLKIAVIDDIQNAGQHSQGSASLVLNKIIEAADKTRTTLQLFPQKHGSKGLSTKQLTDWYSRRGFEFINEFIMERKPTNP